MYSPNLVDIDIGKRLCHSQCDELVGGKGCDCYRHVRRDRGGDERQLANAGAAVVVNYSPDQAGAEKVVEFIQAKGGRAIAIGADVSNPADVERLFAETDKAFDEPLGVLVNDAAMYQFAPLEQVTVENFHKHFDLNVLGVLLAGPGGRRTDSGDKGGTIVNLSGPFFDERFSGTSVYGEQRCGRFASAQSIQQVSWRTRKIRVNAVNPGVVSTEGSAAFLSGDVARAIIASTPLGRLALPTDIARSSSSSHLPKADG